MVRKRIFLFCVFLVVLLCVYWLYLEWDFDGYKGGIALSEQLDTIIHNGDVVKIRGISFDQNTYTFLGALPKNAEVSITSDSQGGSLSEGYYVARLENRIPLKIFSLPSISHDLLFGI